MCVISPCFHPVITITTHQLTPTTNKHQIHSNIINQQQQQQQQNSDYITIDDVAFFVEGAATQRCFAWLDRDHDGAVSADEVADAMAGLVGARRDLASTLQDTDSIVSALATGLGAVLHAVFLAFYLLIFGVDIIQGFSTLSAAVLALTFVFGESLKAVFENSIYLFVAHAFDVGDMLMVAGETSAWRAKKIGLMNSTFLKSNGDLLVVPNAKLRTSAVVNLSRSQGRWDSVSMTIDFPKDPAALKAKVTAALEAQCVKGPAASEFQGMPTVRWAEVEAPLKLKLSVGYTLTFAGDQSGRALNARDGLIGAVTRALADAGATFTQPSGTTLRLKGE